jgi:hypothetical protein
MLQFQLRLASHRSQSLTGNQDLAQNLDEMEE